MLAVGVYLEYMGKPKFRRFIKTADNGSPLAAVFLQARQRDSRRFCGAVGEYVPGFFIIAVVNHDYRQRGSGKTFSKRAGCFAVSVYGD